MNQWTEFTNRLNEWTSPLRPCQDDVERFKSQLKGSGRTLLLGVTKELLPFVDVAVDNNPNVIKTSTKALLADWAEMPFNGEFDVAVGDGSLTAFHGTPERFFQGIKKALKPDGKLVLRLNLSPETKEDLDYVLSFKEKMGFHAFKIRVAHALANPYVAVQDIYRVIKPVWDHPTLEIYRNSPWVYYFPKLSELPKWNHIQFGSSYELAERFPVVTWHVNSSNFPGGNSFT